MKVVGLMSGTSMDGIDAALVELLPDPGEDGVFEWELLEFLSIPYDEGQRDVLREAVEGRAGPGALLALHTGLGEWMAGAVREVCRGSGVAPRELDAVGSHGHTVRHEPPEEGKSGRSLQLGSAAVLAEESGAAVVSDFRAADLAAGGQGAPLVPFADALLFTHPRRARAIQNLGGMGNVTHLPAVEGCLDLTASDRARGAAGSGGPNDAPEILAFDTGPGVALLDVAAELATGGRLRYDRDGALARKGTPDRELLDRLMEDPFFRQAPPRSTGRERFGADLVRRLAGERGLVSGEEEDGWPDILATLVELTARSVAEAYEEWVIPRGVDEVFLTGGGARNPALLEAVRERIRPLPVLPGEELGLDADAREAVAFAVLAWAHVRGMPGNVPSATGARGPRVLGSWTPAPT